MNIRTKSHERSQIPPVRLWQLLLLSLLILVEVYSISQVRVSFEKANLLNFVRMATGVTQDEQSIPDVNNVDQPIPDNRIAPHYDLRLEVGICGVRG